MMRTKRQQTAASTLGTIITLVARGYGVYIGIQYVPQAIESKAIGSILDSIEDSPKNRPRDQYPGRLS